MSGPRALRNFIGGEYVDGRTEARTDIVNPATGSVVATAPVSGAADVDAAYRRLVETALRGDAYAAIATHDEALIEHCLTFAEREGIGRDRFELQMLYGVRPGLQLDLARRGYKVLVATPFGPEWYPYLMRRLAERPANLAFFARNLLRR